MKFERALAALVILGVALACRSTDVLSPLTPAQLCVQRDSLGRTIGGAFPNLIDDFEIMARLLPGGFGGLGTGTVFLKQPELADTTRGTARTLAACPGETLGKSCGEPYSSARYGKPNSIGSSWAIGTRFCSMSGLLVFVRRRCSEGTTGSHIHSGRRQRSTHFGFAPPRWAFPLRCSP